MSHCRGGTRVFSHKFPRWGRILKNIKMVYFTDISLKIVTLHYITPCSGLFTTLYSLHYIIHLQCTCQHNTSWHCSCLSYNQNWRDYAKYDWCAISGESKNLTTLKQPWQLLKLAFHLTANAVTKGILTFDLFIFDGRSIQRLRNSYSQKPRNSEIHRLRDSDIKETHGLRDSGT